MDAIRIDEARRLLRLAAPEQRGLRSVYLNTRTGRRKYWTKWAKPEPKEKNATTLGLEKNKASIAPDFFSSKKTSSGDEISFFVSAGEMSITVNGNYSVSSRVKNRVECALGLKSMINDYISSLPDGSVLCGVPADADQEKRKKKENLYESYGFAKSGKGGLLLGFTKGGKLFPIDKKWMRRNHPHGGELPGYENSYDESGYNQNGYDRNGYDRDGYTVVGYNRHGYDRDGYNRQGYDYYGRRRPE